jgi:hypothetical protein
MMRTWTAVTVALLAFPGAARAGSYLQDDVGLSSTQATEANPQSGSASNNLSGRYEFNDNLGAGAHAEFTHANAAAPPAGSPFTGSPLISGSNVLDLGLSMDWDPTKHLSTSFSLDLGPKSTQYTDTTLTFAGPKGGTITDEGILKTEASSRAGSVGLAYDSADLDAEVAAPFTLSLGAIVGFNTINSTQSIDQVAQGERFLQLEKAACASTKGSKRPSSCRAVLGGESVSVTQFPLELDLLGTIFEDTDVGVSFIYDAYSSDPTSAGLFNVAATGRRKAGGGTSFGGGLPLAPEQFAIRPQLGHSFGKVSVDLSADYGRYVNDADGLSEGDESGLGLKVKWKISKQWRVSASASVTHENPGPAITATNPSAPSTNSSSFGLGVRYTFPTTEPTPVENPADK